MALNPVERRRRLRARIEREAQRIDARYRSKHFEPMNAELAPAVAPREPITRESRHRAPLPRLVIRPKRTI